MTEIDQLFDEQWTLRHLRRDGQLVVPRQVRIAVVLRITADARLEATDGCAHLAGTVVVDESALAVSALSRSDHSCPEIAEFSAGIVAGLSGDVSWQLDDEALTLRSVAGIELVYEQRR